MIYCFILYGLLLTKYFYNQLNLVTYFKWQPEKCFMSQVDEIKMVCVDFQYSFYLVSNLNSCTFKYRC